MLTELKWILQVLFFYLISYNIHLYVTCRKDIVYKSEIPYTIEGTLGGTLLFSLYQSKDNRFYISDYNPDKYVFKKKYNVDYNPHAINSIIITTSNKISGKFNNTLLALNYYYRKFGIRSVVLTESTEVVKKCLEMNILTEPIQEVNPYGMPILRSMLLYIQEHYDVDQYIYINSDILLNPEVFLVAEAIKNDVKQPYVFVGRVTTTKSIPDNLTSYDYNTHLRLEESILWRRTPSQIDYFVFSKNYPFELIYPVVVGRWCVDSAVLYLSHQMHHQIVDFSQIVNYHQGYDGSEQQQLQYEKEDWEWNFKWLMPRRAEKLGSIDANYYIQTPLSNSLLLFSRYLLKKEHFLPTANFSIPY